MAFAERIDSPPFTPVTCGRTSIVVGSPAVPTTAKDSAVSWGLGVTAISSGFSADWPRASETVTATDTDCASVAFGFGCWNVTVPCGSSASAPIPDWLIAAET